MGSYTCMEFLRQYEVNRKTKKIHFNQIYWLNRVFDNKTPYGLTYRMQEVSGF